MRDRKIGFWEVTSIGIGGMVGGGIFAVLGLTIDLAKGAAPVAFAVGGILALLTAYSYAKLAVTYPSEGGSIEYIVQAFGNNLFSAVVNNLLLMSYVIMMALYASAFASYGAVLFGIETHWFKNLLIAGVVLTFTIINLFGAFLTGRSETILVFIKVAILVGFVALGLWTCDWSRLSPDKWETPIKIITGGLIIFLAYEGFELIANATRDAINPRKTIPRALYFSVIFVTLLYISIAIVAVGNVPFEVAKKASDYVLAIAAKPFLGQMGFVIISIAALLSTASAINATLYGAGRAGYLIAKLGEIPAQFSKRIEHGYEGMIILGLLAIIFGISFNLESISIAGSIGFLLIFSLVNLANFKLREQTGGNPFLALLGFGATTGALGILVFYNLQHHPEKLVSSLVAVVGVVLFTLVYYKLGAPLSQVLDQNLREELGKK
ncbi:MAG: amino acid transporter [Epsilonproteobacteria bacterium]|jgi:amino acid transporter|nr:amino acid transporter [Campylobacterota bacterium]NPA88756.1 amino acid permease [Campylobacterota bacterium]